MTCTVVSPQLQMLLARITLHPYHIRFDFLVSLPTAYCALLIGTPGQSLLACLQALIALFHWPGKNELEVLDAGDHQYEVRRASRLACQSVHAPRDRFHPSCKVEGVGRQADWQMGCMLCPCGAL